MKVNIKVTETGRSKDNIYSLGEPNRVIKTSHHDSLDPTPYSLIFPGGL